MLYFLRPESSEGFWQLKCPSYLAPFMRNNEIRVDNRTLFGDPAVDDPSRISLSSFASER